MKKSVLFLTCALTLAAMSASVAQNSRQNIHRAPLRVVVDGSKTPEAITDSEALFILLTRAAMPLNAPADLKKRQETMFSRAVLDATDRTIFRTELAALASDVETHRLRVTASRVAEGSPTPEQVAALRAANTDLIAACQRLHARVLSQMSRSGADRWLTFVAESKKKIKLLAPPESL